MGKYLGPFIESCDIRKALFQFNVPIKEGDNVIGYNHNIVMIYELVDDKGVSHEQNEKVSVETTNDRMGSKDILNFLKSNTPWNEFKQTLKAAKIKYADFDDPDLD